MNTGRITSEILNNVVRVSVGNVNGKGFSKSRAYFCTQRYKKGENSWRTKGGSQFAQLASLRAKKERGIEKYDLRKGTKIIRKQKPSN